jgi:Mrp family chromosome partitioning ATPase
MKYRKITRGIAAASSKAGASKTIAANLAYALAKLQNTILVMGANLTIAEHAARADAISLAAAVSL